jgi:ribokinase
MATITVVGDALLDVHALPSTPPRVGADVPAEIRIGPGGQGANLAVRLARRGQAVRLVCAVGTDPIGDLLGAWLAAEGIEVRTRRAEASGAVVIIGAADGERTMFSRRISVPATAVGDAVAGSTWLVVSGYVLLEPGNGALASGLPPEVRRAVVGCAVPPERTSAWTAAVAGLRPDLVVVNADEASQLSREDPSALGVRAVVGGIAVVTDANGAEAATGDGLVTVGAERLEAVDTTGAGDAFAAVLISELTGGAWPPAAERLESAMTAAARVAAAVTRVPGAQARVEDELGSRSPA